MSEWISVEDRLPISEAEMADHNYLNIEVIIATDSFVSTGYFEAGNTFNFWCEFKDIGEDVTHWMPLPEPPNPHNTGERDGRNRIHARYQ